MDLTGLLIVGLVLAVAAAFGLYRRATDGKVRAVAATETLPEVPGVEDDGGTVIVQFSSEFCAPCRGVRRVIGEVVADRDELRHVEIDVAEHPEAAARFDVLRTPTVIVLDPQRKPRFRVVGPLRKPELNAALDALTLT